MADSLRNAFLVQRGAPQLRTGGCRRRDSLVGFFRCAFHLSAFAALSTLVQAEDQIPTGFKVERYTQVWERNPFAPATNRTAPPQTSAFDKLFLTSWLKDDGKFVVFVQSSDTNEVQRITTEPNQGNLRLIEMHLNSNPALVEAVISSTTEKGAVKFRFGQPSTEQLYSGTAQTGNTGSTGSAPNPGPSQAVMGSPGSSGNAQNSGVPAPPTVNKAVPHWDNRTIPRVQWEDGPPPTRRGHVSG
jgi:hypothetical protein